MNSRMISEDPSKIRLIRMSRRICSAGTPRSPRAAMLVSDLPAHLGAVQLGERRLDPDVLPVAVGQLAGELNDRLDRVGRRGDERDLLGDRLVLADGPAPLDARARPFPGNLDSQLAGRRAAGREREAARVQGGEGDLEALALVPDAAVGRHPDLVKPGYPVLKPAQAHERVALLDGDAVGVSLDHERGDAAAVTLALGHPGHHHQEVSDDSVGGPQLYAVQHVLGSVGGRAGSEPTSGSVSRNALISPRAHLGR